jgi:diguanylate cyclase (GGDEF)-like protein
VVDSDSPKESLVANINRLREAVESESAEDTNSLAFQVFSESLALTGGHSPLESVVKSVSDIFNIKRTGEDEIPSIVAGDKNFLKLREDIANISDFLHSLANGDLSQRLNAKGYLASVLKMFQSHLKQLTWQTQMVSRGDFTQRVNFMGEFATSFNLMIEQLDEARRKQAESEEKYRLLAITDPLTGLPNRRHFFETVSNEFARSKRYGKNLAIIMMDIDHFKNINDTFGHHAGDVVLQAVAQQLMLAMRETDLPGRYGGEEFIGLLPETCISEAQVVAERIRENIQGLTIEAEDHHINVTASFGVSGFDGMVDKYETYDGTVDKYQTIEEVIDDADKALYQAKESGRNRVIIFHEQHMKPLAPRADP